MPKRPANQDPTEGQTPNEPASDQEVSPPTLEIRGDEIESDEPEAPPQEQPPEWTTALITTIKGLQEEVAEMKKTKATPTPTPAPQPEPEPQNQTDEEAFNLEFFTNPRQALENLEERITTKLTKKYTEATSRDKFWDTFYGKYPELKELSGLVEQVTKEKFNDFKELTPDEASKQIASEAKARILRSTGQTSEPESDDTTTLEGDRTRSPKPTLITEEPEEPVSITARLKQYQDRRRKAAQMANRR